MRRILSSLDIGTNSIKLIVAEIIKEKLDCDGLTISQNNEYGQEIKHFHIHLTPRYLKDGCSINYNKDLPLDLDKVLEIITN